MDANGCGTDVVYYPEICSEDRGKTRINCQDRLVTTAVEIQTGTTRTYIITATFSAKCWV